MMIKQQSYATPFPAQKRNAALCVQDMLEVGMVEEPLNSPELLWNRAHFGGWAVSSSPLVIVTRTPPSLLWFAPRARMIASVMVAVFEQGADLSNTTLLKQIIPIIANTEALDVNQAW